MPGQETYQALVSLKNKINRLEAIESNLKQYIEKLKSSQADYSYIAHKTKGAEHWRARGKAEATSQTIKELEDIIK